MSAADVVRTLYTAVQQARHYGGDHPAAVQSVEQLVAAVSAATAGAPALRVELAGQWIAVQATALPPDDRYASQLRAHLTARRIGSLTLEAAAPRTALTALVRCLALEPEELIAAGGLAEALQSAGAEGIVVGAPLGAPTSQDGAYDNAITAVHALFGAAERGNAIDISRAALVAQRIARAAAADRAALWVLLADRGHDELDPCHAVNACVVTVCCGQALHLPDDVVVDLGVAALLHDIGLAALPYTDRLRERSPLPPGPGWRHPAEGAYLLRHLGGRASLPMLVAAEHHLPALGRTDVLPHTNLVAIADYVDGMTCGRVPAMRRASVGGVLTDLLAGSGPAFDPVHVRVLAMLIGDAAASGVQFTSRI